MHLMAWLSVCENISNCLIAADASNTANTRRSLPPTRQHMADWALNGRATAHAVRRKAPIFVMSNKTNVIFYSGTHSTIFMYFPPGYMYVYV